MALKKIKISLFFIIAIILVLGLSISFQSLLAAWIAPAANPPTCATGNAGCDAPLNAGPLIQLKSGALWLNTSGLSPYGLIVENGKVGIGTASPGQKLDVVGNIKASGSFMGQGGKNITHLPWYNIGASFTGYLKLVTPIVHNESNMFVIKITGYEYGQGGKVSDIKCGGYAYGGSTLISKYCYTDGTNLPVEIGTEVRGGTTYVVIRLGTPTWSAWYYSHFTAEYTGWKSKDPSGFTWVEGETTPAQTGNTNNVDVNDQAGTITTTGTANIGNYLLINGKYAIDGTDSYLRLNQQGSFTSGIYTPYVFRADGIIYTNSSFRFLGSAKTIMDSNQFYCNNGSNCHFNYSGTGQTHIGNSAGTYIHGTAYANGQALRQANGTNCPSTSGLSYLPLAGGTMNSGSTIGFNGGSGYGVGVGAASPNKNSIAVDTLETDGGVGGGGTLELNYYGGNAVTIGPGGTKPLYAAIMYDGNNTGYYVDPAGTSRLNTVAADRVYGYADIRSPIFYDYNNTGYYVDPASTSRFNTINLGGVSRSSWPGGSGFTGSGSTNYLAKFTGATSLGNSIIYDNGNVGIGITNPNAKLSTYNQTCPSGWNCHISTWDIAAQSAQLYGILKVGSNASFGGNVYANDYWIGAAGKWASQVGQAGHNNCYLLDFPPGTGEGNARWCMAGYYMAGYYRFGEGDLERFYCCRP